jgi:hypothetical protein
VNAIEAPELVTGLKSLYKNVNVQDVGPMTKRAQKDLLRRGTSFLSSGFLYYAFGVAPLISDMRKISKSLKSLDSKIKKVSKASEQYVTARDKKVGKFGGFNRSGNAGEGPSFDFTSVSWGGGSQYGGEQVQLQVIPVIEPTVIATVHGTYDWGFGSASEKKLSYLISRFGANGPASFVWEKIPYSFVVDWFVDLSGVIDALDNALTGFGKSVTDCCVSEKWECDVRCIHIASSPSNSLTYNNDLMATVKLSAYARIPFKPSIMPALSGRFGKYQAGLTAALVGQMAANLLKKK